MEDEGSAAYFIWLIVLIVLELMVLEIWSAISYIRSREIDEDSELLKKNPFRFLLIFSNQHIHFEHIGVVIFAIMNFASGCLFVPVAFRKIFLMVKNANWFCSAWPDISLDIMIVLSFAVVLVLLYLMFGIWIPKKIVSTMPIQTSAEEQIISMVNEGCEQGDLKDSEAEMITNIFEFSDKEAKDIMINRSNVIAIDAEMALPDAVDFMISQKCSRYPIYEESLDTIIGILHFKDAIRLQATGKRPRGKIKNYPELIREAVFIPETRKLDILFKSMQSSKTQMVIVVDEYGQTSGIVAVEDILEEIVGNLMDEYDIDEDYIEEKGENVYEIDGLTPLDELGEELGITFDGMDYETLNGFIISRMEHIPVENEKFETDYKGYHFKVLSVENKVVKNVYVKKQ